MTNNNNNNNRVPWFKEVRRTTVRDIDYVLYECYHCKKVETWKVKPSQLLDDDVIAKRHECLVEN